MTIKEYRKHRGWTQAEAAAHLGVHVSAWNQWEYGTRTPGAKACMDFANKLNCVVYWKPGREELSLIPAELWEPPDVGGMDHSSG